jgi:probable F420-dependent oxidoreductase
MKLDTMMVGGVRGAPREARQAEELGFDGVFCAEGPQDGFLPLAAAAEHTDRIQLGTAVAVAFSRNPMTLAHLGHDLHLASDGRFILGLGSQVKGHIERRYSMPWSQPAARMREMVEAVRAIWRSWNEGTPLDFRGDFYSHTLMTPMFTPPPSPSSPPVWLAAIGPMMTRVAGEVADGLICHPMLSELYLRRHVVPSVAEGLQHRHRALGAIERSAMVMVATGCDETQLAEAVSMTRLRLAFYASTPSYRVVLDAHGWGDLQPALHRLVKQGDWAAIAERIDDEVLHTFAVIAEPDDVAMHLLERFGGLLDRVILSTARPIDIETMSSIREGLARSAAVRS